MHRIEATDKLGSKRRGAVKTSLVPGAFNPLIVDRYVGTRGAMTRRIRQGEDIMHHPGAQEGVRMHRLAHMHEYIG